VPRVVFDANVFISALLSPRGAPRELMRLWLEGVFDLVVSPLLLAELERALSYPKISELVTRAEAEEVVEELRRNAEIVDDPPEVETGATSDPGDDYLVALARAAGAQVIVSGDAHLAGASGLEPPALTPRAFLDLLEQA
jgi:putative PIN family toxin of toxin-antitoxin system